MTTAITVENLGKKYRIGTAISNKLSVREALMHAMRFPVRRFRGENRDDDSTIWALKDLNFEVRTGEAVGIVGRNGAGKSTLLKILSRITRPTTGRATMRGRVTSLLEVGSGFHPDLTGRDNIFLNGAVLGMTRAEMRQKFDAIVAFAELERFIDTPIKFYSSGMYMRLAFSVAAHLEAQILILDEVLAVGDASFQQKSQMRMEAIIRQGCTLLLVTHNLHAIGHLCSRALYLEQGMLVRDGLPHEVISQYLGQVTPQRVEPGECHWPEMQEAPGNENVRLHAVRVVSEGQVTARVDVHAPVQIELEYWNLRPDAHVYASIHILEQTGVGVLSSANLPSLNSTPDPWHGKPHPVGLYRSVCTIPPHLLNEERYVVSVFIVTNMERTDVVAHNVIAFQVFDQTTREYQGRLMGVVRPKLAWQTDFVQPSR